MLAILTHLKKEKKDNVVLYSLMIGFMCPTVMFGIKYVQIKICATRLQPKLLRKQGSYQSTSV